MVGLKELDLFREIEIGYSRMSNVSLNISDQPALNPDDALVKLATGIAKAIEANNLAITEQLRRAGIEI